MKVYTLTHDQLFHLWHKAHSRGVDICLLNLGIDTKVEDDIFREYVATITTEPSADVVEQIATALIAAIPEIGTWTDEDENAHTAAVALAPIIEAEVERRVRERATVFVHKTSAVGTTEQIGTCVPPYCRVTMDHQHDHDYWPEPGMEEKR